MISFRWFFQWSDHKVSASAFLLWSGNLWNSTTTQFCSFPQFCFTIHIRNLTDCNAYALVQKKIEDTNYARARLKEIPVNLYWMFFPLYKLLNHNFQLFTHGKNKIEAPTSQSTNLYIKSGTIRSHLSPQPGWVTQTKWHKTIENQDYNLSQLPAFKAH